MRKKVSWTVWKKQLKQYVASGTKLPAVEVNEENGKEENEPVVDGSSYNDDHHIGDLSIGSSSSCEDLKSSDDARQREEEKQPQQQSCSLKANVPEVELAPLTPPRSNPPLGSAAPQRSSPPTPPGSRSNSVSASAVGSALSKGAFKHVYRSGPVRKKLSTRTTSEGGGALSDVSGASQQKEEMWSEGISNPIRMLEEELGQTQFSSTQHMISQPTPGGADRKNTNGEWDADTRSLADCEASAQLKQVAAIKRERTREYAHALRRLRYGLEQNNKGSTARALQATDDKLLDKPGYVLNWLERAQGVAVNDNNYVPKTVSSDATQKQLPSEISLSLNNGIDNGTATQKKKPKSTSVRGTEKENSKRSSDNKTTKPKTGDEEKKSNNRNDDQKTKQLRENLSEAVTTTIHSPLGGADNVGNRFDADHGIEELYLQNRSSSASPPHPTSTGSNNKNDRRRRNSTARGNNATAAAAAAEVVTSTEQQQRKLSSSPFAGGKASIPSAGGNRKKLPFKI
ncbi:unnamed protein product [Sphagnum troendelagicum]|uniref:Uncharacterized protein n=1 Tax=Sphagnum troendelagicum TaxID=128251 RepID=A0ABP0V426_9BRYO